VGAPSWDELSEAQKAEADATRESGQMPATVKECTVFAAKLSALEPNKPPVWHDSVYNWAQREMRR